MDIDSAAPVKARTQMLIAADPQHVWGALTDFESWPAWKQAVRSMSLRGP